MAPGRTPRCLTSSSLSGSEDQGRDRQVPAEDENPGRVEDRIADKASDGRVEAGYGREPGQLCVGQSLWHQNGGKNDARDDVGSCPSAVVGSNGPETRYPPRYSQRPSVHGAPVPLVTFSRHAVGPEPTMRSKRQSENGLGPPILVLNHNLPGRIHDSRKDRCLDPWIGKKACYGTRADAIGGLGDGSGYSLRSANIDPGRMDI